MSNEFQDAALRVENLGSQPPGIPETLDLMFEGKHYVFEPSMSALAPRAAVKLWFGDNEVTEDPNRRWNRTDELARLRTRYGLMDAERVATLGLNDWSEGLPKVKVTTYDGDEVTMLIHDLEGRSVRVATTTEAQSELYESRIDALERELRALKMSKEMALPNANATAADVPEDTPGRSRGRAS